MTNDTIRSVGDKAMDQDPPHIHIDLTINMNLCGGTKGKMP